MSLPPSSFPLRYAFMLVIFYEPADSGQSQGQPPAAESTILQVFFQN